MIALFLEILVVASAHLWAAWVATLILHTVVLTSLVFLLTRGQRVAAADEVVLWRVAFLAPPFTAAVPALFGMATWGSLPLPSLVPTSLAVWQGSVVVLFLIATVLSVRARRAVLEHRALHACFGVRRPSEPMLVAEVEGLARLLNMRRVRVTMSDLNASPAAIGSHEICLHHGFSDLPIDQRRALIAHELAHLARRDTAWFRWSRRAAWCVPGANWLMRSMRHASERAADDRAVAATGDPDALAEALVAVATTMGSSPLVAAATGAPLVERVTRLLQPRPPRRAWSAIRRTIIGLTLIGATLYFAPAFRLTLDDAGNRVEWLRPSKEEPNNRMLYVRYTLRRIERQLRAIL